MASKMTFSIFMVLLVFTAKANKMNDSIDDLVYKLQTAVGSAVKSADSVTFKAQEILVEVVKSTETESSRAMEETEEDYMKDLDLIKQDAAEANISIDDCLGDNETNLINISTDFFADLRECMKTTYDEGYIYVQKSFDNIIDLMGEIEDIGNDINACGTGSTSNICLDQVKTKIIHKTRSLPLQIKANAATAATQIIQISPLVVECATNKTATWTAKGDALLDTIKKCVEEKQ